MGRAGPAAAPRPPSMDDVRCPVCADILLEPVTMPCGHSACLHCFERSSCCPRCRLRVSSWARKRSREKGLVNAELWDVVRRSYPEKCQRRLEQRDGQAAGEGGRLYSDS
uniref:RING-type E3 ubiquitin transferase n=2 Tax=Denticeps clupeoides TaxID=299321 RepID=A0AAY4CAL5_9TELE